MVVPTSFSDFLVSNLCGLLASLSKLSCQNKIVSFFSWSVSVVSYKYPNFKVRPYISFFIRFSFALFLVIINYCYLSHFFAYFRNLTIYRCVSYNSVLPKDSICLSLSKQRQYCRKMFENKC